jgi:hypothetical protein
MARKKGLGSIASAAGTLASRAGSLSRTSLRSRFPFLSRKPASSPEPFSAIEDDTPLGDILSSANVAPGMAKESAGGEKSDFRGLAASALGAALKKPVVLASVFVVLALLVALALTSLIVAAPPKAALPPHPFSEQGEALVKTWLPPPGDPLEPRMPMEREGPPAYGPDDAARIGIDPDPIALAELRDKNDQEIDKMLGAAP